MNLIKLKGIIPDQVLTELPLTIEKFKIDSSLRISHFLAQVAHESNNFSAKVENLNYSKEGLLKIFPKYFTAATALQYQRQPEKIASKVYANRMGNGDETSKEGYTFKGRGYIQLTGKDNYTNFDKIVEDNILANPNLVAEKYPLLSAAWFWDKNNLNSIADLGESTEVITKVSKKINGGVIGLQDRIDKFKNYYTLLK